jgi:dTDP-4-dehydrorhamnose 3,5-epimerase
MKFIQAPFEGAYIIEMEPFLDERGFFVRTFCQEEFAEIGFKKQIVQINHSLTRQKGTIRGLHYQLPPASETKIIRCIQGAVFDVMVDIRANSPTFMQWYGIELSKDNMRMGYIPEGFAHGFQTLTNDAEMIYYHTEFYNPEHERGLRPDDPALMIKWPLPMSAISPKDDSYSFIGRNFKGIAL